MLDILLDTLIDTLKIMTFLYLAFLIIELIEHKLSKKNQKVLIKNKKYGPLLGGIPTIIVAFSISPICGIIVLVTIVLVQFIEGNIIHPLVVGKAVDIHPVTIVITLIIFEYYFGIIGMILATPIVGAIKILFNYFNKRFHFTEKIKPNKIEVK